jgi:hypothetical protein
MAPIRLIADDQPTPAVRDDAGLIVASIAAWAP